jgi:hypothetical protein
VRAAFLGIAWHLINPCSAPVTGLPRLGRTWAETGRGSASLSFIGC